MDDLRFRFEDHVLDVDRRELTRAGATVPLEPQVFDLLVYVIRNRGRVVSKDDLVEAVWGGRAISDSTLTTRINAMRKALGDSGEEQRLIRTVARKGIRFVGEVTEGEAVAPAPSASEPPALALPDKPSIAVLPFQNMSGDPSQDYFCDGMVEEIITALSRFHWLFVIARNSTFTYKGRAVDVKQVARDLGVRYVLEGSVRKAGDKVRITGQLIDATTGAHLWADRFDGDLADVFELQDKVAHDVVGIIEPKLRQAEIDRTRRKPTEHLDAYDHLLRAYAQFHRISREGNAQALIHLNRALAIDPDFAAAAGLAAWCYHWRRPQGWIVDEEQERREGCRLARIVADGDKTDATAMAYAAHAMASLCRDHRAAEILIDHALRLNPNSFTVLNVNGWVRLNLHQYDRAQPSFEAAHRLSPLDPLVGSMMCGLSHVHALQGRFREALHWAELGVQANPTFTSSYVALIVAQVYLGHLDEARATVRRLLEINPSASLTRSRASGYKDNSLLEPRFAALRAAGLPE